jgi:hypothetical protein
VKDTSVHQASKIFKRSLTPVCLPLASTSNPISKFPCFCPTIGSKYSHKSLLDPVVASYKALSTTSQNASQPLLQSSKPLSKQHLTPSTNANRRPLSLNTPLKHTPPRRTIPMKHQIPILPIVNRRSTPRNLQLKRPIRHHQRRIALRIRAR